MIDKNNKGKYNNINIHNKNHNFKRRITTTFNVILILLFSFCELTIARLKFPLGLLPFSNPLKPKRKGAIQLLHRQLALLGWSRLQLVRSWCYQMRTQMHSLVLRRMLLQLKIGLAERVPFQCLHG